MAIGRLEEVDLRKIWKNEALDFTRWLAEPENIELLSKELRLNLSDIQIEQNVGNFFCDIICKDTFSEKMVIIENQLEQTNHDHLGKIITYASGLDASFIVWIVKEARDEHASAIQWLNSNIKEGIYFFLVEVKAWKIGDSDPAPKFIIIEQPNDYNKTIRTIVEGEMTESKKIRLEFWENFNKVMIKRMEKQKHFGIRKASTEQWYSFAIGSSICLLSAYLKIREKKITVGLWIPNDKGLYDYLFSQKEHIEKKMGPLTWNRLDNKKGSGFDVEFGGFDPGNTENYDELSNKIIDIAIDFKAVVRPMIDRYRPGDVSE
jgi:hypothetical protein